MAFSREHLSRCQLRARVGVVAAPPADSPCLFMFPWLVGWRLVLLPSSGYCGSKAGVGGGGGRLSSCVRPDPASSRSERTLRPPGLRPEILLPADSCSGPDGPPIPSERALKGCPACGEGDWRRDGDVFACRAFSRRSDVLQGRLRPRSAVDRSRVGC